MFWLCLGCYKWSSKTCYRQGRFLDHFYQLTFQILNINRFISNFDMSNVNDQIWKCNLFHQFLTVFKGMRHKSLGPNFFWSPGTTRPRRICDWLETIMHMTRSITDVKSTWLQYNSLTFTSSKQTDQPIISSFDYWRGEHVDKTPQQPHFHWFKTNWPTNHKQYNSVKRGKGNESIVGRAATGCYTV